MTVTTSTNSVNKQDITAPGVVLAVSPTNTQLLINDQARHLFYLYRLRAARLSPLAAWVRQHSGRLTARRSTYTTTRS